MTSKYKLPDPGWGYMPNQRTPTPLYSEEQMLDAYKDGYEKGLELSGWQPIETAPRYKLIIAIHRGSPNFVMPVNLFVTEKNVRYWVGGSSTYAFEAFTHWIPLTKTPTDV